MHLIFNMLQTFILIIHQSVWKMHLLFYMLQTFLFIYIFQNKWFSTMQVSFTYTPCSQMHLNFYISYLLLILCHHIFLSFTSPYGKKQLNFQIYSSTINKFLPCYILSKKLGLLYTFQK